MKVAVANLKGGSGKTLSSFFLATALSRRGKTLLVDCDPQGSSLPWAEGAEEDGGGGGRLPFAVIGLPVMGAEIPFLGMYSDAFGAAIEDLGEYERAARERLGEEDR